MYGNPYASASGSTDTTTNNTLPTTSRTHHSQPRPQFIPAAVALPSDDPHLAGNEACRCSSCHLRTRLFPRNQHGRIVLPHLSSLVTRLPPPTMTNVVVPPPSLETMAYDPQINQGRRGGRRSRALQSDKGEGSSTGMSESWLHRNSHERTSTDETSSRRHKSEDPSRRSQPSKKRDHKSRRPDPWPRIMESEDAGQPSHSQQPSSPPLDKSRRTRLDMFPDKHGTLQNMSRPQMTKFETSRSVTPSTIAIQRHIGSYDYNPTSSHRHQGPSMSMAISNYPDPPGSHLETSSQRHHHDSTSPIDLNQDEPKMMRFSFHSTVTTDDPSSRSPSSHQPQFEDNHFQTQYRFQEPVVPEADTTSPILTRNLSTVQVKWDSERKRRQGYFAQEEGAEKSPFRHYNKANCDFEG